MSHPPATTPHTRFDDPVLAAMAARRSVSKVGPETPSDDELLALLDAVTPVADHKALKPWRLLTLRGADRLRLGAALDAADGREPADRPNPKPLRAELLIAVIASPVEHPKVPTWEQHATAAGAAHLLELALWQAGWGVMWRTGLAANAPQVRALHGLRESELLMGWLYVGSIDPHFRTRLETSHRPPKDARPFLGVLPAPEAVAESGADSPVPAAPGENSDTPAGSAAAEEAGQGTGQKAAKHVKKQAKKKAAKKAAKHAKKKAAKNAATKSTNRAEKKKGKKAVKAAAKKTGKNPVKAGR